MKLHEISKSELLPVITGLYEHPFIISDKRGNILYSNKLAEEFLKIELTSHNLFDIFTGGTSELLYNILNNSPAPGQQVVKLLFRNGDTHTVKLSHKCFVSAEESFTSFLLHTEQLYFSGKHEVELDTESGSVNQDLLDLIKKNFPFTMFGKDQVRKKADELRDFFWLKDTNGKFILVNKSFAEYIGVQPGKIEDSLEEQFIPDYLRKLLSGINEYVVKSGKALKSSGILYGSLPTSRTRFDYPLLDRSNRVFAVAGMTMAETMKSETKFNDFLDVMPVPAAVISQEGNIKFCTEEFCSLFSFDKKNSNIHYKKILPPEFSSFLGSFIQSGRSEERKELTGDNLTGNSFTSGYAVQLKKETVSSGTYTIVFIDKNKSSFDMQESPNQKSKVYDILIQSNPEPVFIYEKENLRFIEVNQAALTLYGFTKNEFLQMDLTDLYAPEDIQTLLSALNEKIKEGEFSGPFRQKRKDGTYIFVEISKFTLKYGGKEAHFNIARDVSAKLESEKQANLFKTAFESTDQVVFITDASGFIRVVNDSASRVLGYKKDDLVRTAFAALVKDDERGRINSGIFNSRSADVKKLPMEIKTSKGSYIKMNLTAASIKDYKNDIDSFIITCSIEAEEKLKEVTREVVVERIVPADAPAGGESNVLLSGVFHEILTPINVILGFVQEITESLPSLTPEQREAADIINQNRLSLLNTMNSIIEYNDLEKKIPELTLYNITCGEIIDNLQSDFKELSKSRGIEIFSGRISTSLYFETDKSKFTNLLFLLSKIAGYLSKDKKVSLSIYPLDQERFAVTFKNGKLYSSFTEDMVRVFSSGNINSTDAGIPKLSMKIASRLISILKGELYVSRDNSEVGFTFPVKLKKNLITSEKKSTGSSLPPVSFRETPRPETKKISRDTFLNLSSLNCIYIEDQVDSQILFKVQMKDLGDIQFAASFEEALSLMDKKRFDFIVMDINLQGEYNGLDALRIIQKMPEFRKIPVIAVTAYLLQGDRDKFISAGFHEFVAKPIFRDRMIEALEKVLQRT